MQSVQLILSIGNTVRSSMSISGFYLRVLLLLAGILKALTEKSGLDMPLQHIVCSQHGHCAHVTLAR